MRCRTTRSARTGSFWASLAALSSQKSKKAARRHSTSEEDGSVRAPSSSERSPALVEAVRVLRTVVLDVQLLVSVLLGDSVEGNDS